MKPADYICPKCGSEDTIWIKNRNDFPEYVICKQCGDRSVRKFEGLTPIVYQGKAGNYKNGYKSSSVNIRKTGAKP